jgi:diguanylate cyclase (GGDEF)-like protein
MAIAASPIMGSKGFLDVLREKVPPQDRALELNRRLLALNELAASLNAGKNLAQLKKCITAYFGSWMPRASVSLWLADGRKYRGCCLSGPSDPAKEGFFSHPQGIAGTILRTGTPFWFQDVGTDTDVPLTAASPVASIIALPLTALGRLTGALEIVSRDAGAFDEVEYHLALLAAAHLSAALDNVMTKQKLAATNVRLRDRDLRLTQMNGQLQQLAHTDDLTGLLNKRRLFEQLEAEVARGRRYGGMLSCLMIDIDKFKSVNDTYGHPAGDEVLRQIGSLFRHNLRATDFVVRFGGEEFTVLLPCTGSEDAYRVAEKLRLIFKEHVFVLPDRTPVKITITVGISSCTTFEDVDAMEIVLRADSALYSAKRAGRDCICRSEMGCGPVAVKNLATK